MSARAKTILLILFIILLLVTNGLTLAWATSATSRAEVNRLRAEVAEEKNFAVQPVREERLGWLEMKEVEIKKLVNRQEYIDAKLTALKAALDARDFDQASEILKSAMPNVPQPE